jgi:hypothetical protein
VYFIDDLNMPYVDKYDTQSAIELARQMVDYRGWWVLGFAVRMPPPVAGVCWQAWNGRGPWKEYATAPS